MLYEQIPTQFNISYHIIEQCNIQKGRAEKVAFYFQDRSYTYKQLSDMVNQCANFMKNAGVQKGQRIGIFMHDRPEFIAIFFGAIKIGAVVALMNPKISLEQLANLVQDASAVQLYTGGGLCDGLENPLESLQGLYDIDSVWEKIEKESKECAAADTTKDDPAFILYTSGSSGKQKGVIHLHHDMLIASHTYGEHILKVTSEDVFYSHSKLSFAFGLATSIIYPFFAGATSILNPEDSIYEICDILDKYHPTVFFAVPSVYSSLLKVGKEREINLGNCRYCGSTGEALPKTIGESWSEKFGIDIFQGLGTSETVNFAISNRQGCNKYGSLGKPIPGYEVKIIDEDWNELPIGEIGEIYVEGHTLMQGYLNDPEQTSRVLRGNGMRTGDRGYIDDEGFIWYLGRNTNTFKFSGKWVNALIIENIILEVENIAEVAVDSKFSDDSLPQIVAYLSSEGNDYEQSVKDIKKNIRRKLERTWIPKKFYFVTKLPKGITGKIQRNQLDSVPVLCEL